MATAGKNSGIKPSKIMPPPRPVMPVSSEVARLLRVRMISAGMVLAGWVFRQLCSLGCKPNTCQIIKGLLGLATQSTH